MTLSLALIFVGNTKLNLSCIQGVRGGTVYVHIIVATGRDMQALLMERLVR
jgi:hypothetical protein